MENGSYKHCIVSINNSINSIEYSRKPFFRFQIIITKIDTICNQRLSILIQIYYISVTSMNKIYLLVYLLVHMFKIFLATYVEYYSKAYFM